MIVKVILKIECDPISQPGDLSCQTFCNWVGVVPNEKFFQSQTILGRENMKVAGNFPKH